VLIGRPAPRTFWQRASSQPLTAQLLRDLPGIDLRIVANRTQRRTEEA
jgi:K+-sensing histidine kinase KdpD